MIMKKTTLLLLALCLLPTPSFAADFRPLRRSWLEEGQVIHPATVKQVVIGMSKDQVYRVIGAPHFNEGIGSVTWNYIFQLQSDGKKVANNCQYLIHYKHRKIDEIRWRDQACAALVQ
jgi:OmpA-OmpF porin, OOP family